MYNGASFFQGNFMSLLSPSFQQKIFSPVCGQSLAFMRISFGLLLVWSVWKYLFLAHHVLYYSYFQVPLHFKHHWFQWVDVWPSVTIMYLHYFVMLIAAFFMMVGFYYRISAVVAITMFAYAFLVDLTHYLNHYYLMIVVGYLLAMLPANRMWSIDALRHPEWGKGDVPLWSVWSVRSLFEIVLLYAGIVKLNPDWLRLEPLGTWLRDTYPWHFFSDLIHYDWFIAIGAYGTIALHIIGAPLLLWRKTRLAVFFVYCAFHLCNSYTFDIGVFPYMTIAATLIFFSYDWPSQFWAWCIAKKEAFKQRYANRAKLPSRDGLFPKVALGFVVIFLIIQILLPMRPLLYPGREAWTQEGNQFSWRMKLTDTRATKAIFTVVDPVSGEKWIIDKFKKYMDRKHYMVMTGNPAYMLQFARHLEEEWRQKGYDDVAVYAEVWLSLNFRKPQLFLDPTVDLTEVEWDWKPATWIMPQTEPFLHWKDRPKAEPGHQDD